MARRYLPVISDDLPEGDWNVDPNPTAWSRQDVAHALGLQPGNQQRSEAFLSERWVVSDVFVPVTIHAWLPDLGITPGKTGRSRTVGPIIVDANPLELGRHEGQYGPAPDFLVLDGQNRLVKARQSGPCAMLDAVVGDAVLDSVLAQERRYAEWCDNLDYLVHRYLGQSPGSTFGVLREYARQGLVTQKWLDELRARRKNQP
jgi:hypothetical protein